MEELNLLFAMSPSLAKWGNRQKPPIEDVTGVYRHFELEGGARSTRPRVYRLLRLMRQLDDLAVPYKVGRAPLPANKPIKRMDYANRH